MGEEVEKGREGGVQRDELDGAAILFFDSTPLNPCVACILVFKPVRALFLRRALGCVTHRFSLT